MAAGGLLWVEWGTWIASYERSHLLSKTAYRMPHLLCALVVACPIGTNPGLLCPICPLLL